MSKGAVEPFIRKLRNRIWLEKIVGSLIVSLLYAAACVLLLSVLGHFTVIVHPFSKAAFLLAAACVAGTAVGVARRPGMKRAALEGDRLGLQDRLITYLEYRDRGGAVLGAFRRELDQVLAGCSPAGLYPVKIRWRGALAVVLITAVAACLFLVPSPRVEEARWKEAVNKEMRQEAENAAVMKSAYAEGAAKKDEPSGSLLAEREALLANLEKELNQSYSYREAALQVADTLKELERIRPGITSEDIKGLAGIFEGAGEKFAGGAGLLKNGDAAGAARALQNLPISQDERGTMLENVNRLLEDPAGAQARKKILQNIKTGLAQQDFNGQKLSEALRTPPGGGDAGGAPEVDTKLESMKERLLAKSGEGFESQRGGSKGTMFTDGGSADLKEGEITDREAASVAQGDTGSQAARNPDAVGGTPGSGGGGEAGREGLLARSEEAVFAGGESAGNPQELQGRWQEEGGRLTDRLSSRVIGLEGESGGRETLYVEFVEDGMTYMDKFAIPPGQRELVLEYFKKLNGED
jgi:hypothetical protein